MAVEQPENRITKAVTDFTGPDLFPILPGWEVKGWRTEKTKLSTFFLGVGRSEKEISNQIEVTDPAKITDWVFSTYTKESGSLVFTVRPHDRSVHLMYTPRRSLEETISLRASGLQLVELDYTAMMATFTGRHRSYQVQDNGLAHLFRSTHSFTELHFSK